ncbi:MAG: lysophospholipid acyltransferase family protein [Alloprevotella sp.]|nr:lysophospholipid acyltransferase family protein [Alloprevotella sp.]MBR1594962.1 lysophospholipid acyltransferase family protein [Alloprevotella sp.]
MSKLLDIFFRLSSMLPLRVHYLVADCLLYPIIYYIVGYRKRVVRRNLENAFPEKDEKERRTIERGFYHFFCDYIVETCRYYAMSEAEMKRHLIFEGIEDMERELETRDFVFVYLGHYGNWEWISALQLYVNPAIQCAFLYRPLANKAFDDLFLNIRNRMGSESIAKNDSLRRILTMKREGKKAIIGFISDQSPRRTNIHLWVDFLSQDTPVFTGTERIAKKVNAAVYFADVTRESRGHYRCHMRPLTSSPNDYPDYQVTELYMKELEAMIRRNPSIWLWSHKRWKRKREG